MNIECLKEKLVYSIAKAEKITGKNITLPVLNRILLEATKTSLTIKATNLDIGIEISIPVKTIKEGKVAVPGNIFYNFIANINDKNITLEANNDNLKIKTKNSEAIIKTLPTDDFPNIPKADTTNPININSQNLVKGFKSVSYSASVSTIRPVLSSVMVYSDEEELVFVATDSFRLAEKRINTKKNKNINNILIPFKNVTEIVRMIEDMKEDIVLYINPNQIAIQYGEIYITSRIVDGNFPDYKQIIPKEVKTEIILLKQDFINNLKISNIFTDKFSQVVFDISVGSKKFKISTQNSDIGENENIIESVIKGESIKVSFNQKYIIDCLQSIDVESVSLSFVDSSKAMVIRGVGDSSFLYLVMPMNK